MHLDNYQNNKFIISHHTWSKRPRLR